MALLLEQGLCGLRGYDDRLVLRNDLLMLGLCEDKVTTGLMQPGLPMASGPADTRDPQGHSYPLLKLKDTLLSAELQNKTAAFWSL